MSQPAESVPRPWWLTAVFGVEAVGWVLQSVFALLFSAIDASMGDRGLEATYLAIQVIVAAAAAVVFIVAIVRPIRDSVAARFAKTHILASALVSVPLLILLGWHLVTDFASFDAPKFGYAALWTTLMIGAPLVLLRASKSESTGWVVLAGAASLLWLMLMAFVLFGMGVGVAGITA